MGKSRRKLSSNLEKTIFLVEHLELMQAPTQAVVRAMKQAGLIAPSTFVLDVDIASRKQEALVILKAKQEGVNSK